MRRYEKFHYSPPVPGATDFYPASGSRSAVTGGLYDVGTFGYAWSSSPCAATSVRSSLLGILSSNVIPEYDSDRSIGRPVRCVQE